MIQYNHSPYPRATRQFLQGTIEFHDVLRLLEPPGAEPGTHQGEGQLTLASSHFLEPHPLAAVGVPVVPFAPLDVIHREDRFLSLLLAQVHKKSLGRFLDRFRADPCFPDRKKSLGRLAVEEHSLEGFVQGRLAVAARSAAGRSLGEQKVGEK